MASISIAQQNFRAQGLVGAVFTLSYFGVERDSCWLLVPALLHGGLVAAWLLRRPLQTFVNATTFRK